MRKHALLNAIVPGIQVIALQLAWLAGGVVIVEYLFSYPGIGALLVDSVRNSDFPMVQVLAMVIAARLRGGQPDRGHPVHPVHPASEDGDLVMSVISPAQPPPHREPAPARHRTGDHRCSSRSSRSSARWFAPYGENEIVGKPYTQRGLAPRHRLPRP